MRAGYIMETIQEFCTNNIEALHLLDEFDYSKNKLTPDKISINDSKNKVWWYCKKCDHSFAELPYNRKRYLTAPCCTGKQATKNRNFGLLYKELLKDWDYCKNDINPYDILPNDHRNINWKCHICNNEWSTKLTSRVINFDKYGYSTCPKCSNKQTSKAEIIILTILKHTFSDIKHRYKINNIEYDLFIPSIGLAIEYDGIVWHDNKSNNHINKLINAKNNNILLINIVEYYNDNGKPLDRYTNEHIIFPFKISKSYDITKDLYDLTYSIFRSNKIKLNHVDINIIMEELNKVRKQVIEDKSLYNEMPWLINWYSTNNKTPINHITKGSEEKIELVCPECKAIRNIKVHYIKNNFRGCSVCKSKVYIPDEFLERIKLRDKKANDMKKEKKNKGYKNG